LLAPKENRRKEMRFAAAQITAKSAFIPRSRETHFQVGQTKKRTSGPQLLQDPKLRLMHRISPKSSKIHPSKKQHILDRLWFYHQNRPVLC